MKYTLTLSNKKDLERIQALLENYYKIMTLLDADSKKTPDGGACMHYEIEIKLKEIWS